MVTGWPHMSNPADETFYIITTISVFFLVLNTAVMIYFVVRFNSKRNPVAVDVKDNMALEITWTVVPTILVLGMFFIGWKGFQYMRTAPDDAMIVHVTARQWSWSFRYDNGKETNVLKVPVHKPVKLLITSADVLHSLFIPAYRIKEDAVPGRETHLWFLPDKVGSYDLFCTEYCGVAHSNMITKVEVVPEQDFADWYAGKTAVAKTDDDHAEHKEEALPGAVLIETKGCTGCHSTDGTPKIGPTFKSVFGKKEIVIRGGKEREITVDEAFIRQTLLNPELDRVKGYPPIMPSQKGVLTDSEIEEIIEYLRAL